MPGEFDSKEVPCLELRPEPHHTTIQDRHLQRPGTVGNRPTLLNRRVGYRGIATAPHRIDSFGNLRRGRRLSLGGHHREGKGQELAMRSRVDRRGPGGAKGRWPSPAGGTAGPRAGFEEHEADGADMLPGGVRPCCLWPRRPAVRRTSARNCAASTWLALRVALKGNGVPHRRGGRRTGPLCTQGGSGCSSRRYRRRPSTAGRGWGLRRRPWGRRRAEWRPRWRELWRTSMKSSRKRCCFTSPPSLRPAPAYDVSPSWATRDDHPAQSAARRAAPKGVRVPCLRLAQQGQAVAPTCFAGRVDTVGPVPLGGGVATTVVADPTGQSSPIGGRREGTGLQRRRHAVLDTASGPTLNKLTSIRGSEGDG